MEAFLIYMTLLLRSGTHQSTEGRFYHQLATRVLQLVESAIKQLICETLILYSSTATHCHHKASPYYGHSSLNVMNMHLVNIDVWSHVGPYLGIDEALSARTRMMTKR